MASEPPVLGFLLNDVARLLRKRFEQHARDHGLTRAQWQVLAYLARNEGIPQARLAELLEVEAITLVRLLDKLEARGLIERRQHPSDRRIWLLHLREAAHPILESMRPLGDLTRAEAFEGISAAQRDALLKTLCTMKTNLIEACGRPVESREARHG